MTKENQEWQEKLEEKRDLITLSYDDKGIATAKLDVDWLLNFISKEIAQAKREVVEKLFKIESEKWKDAEHCTCLGYAIVEVAGGEDSEDGKEMTKRLLELRGINLSGDK